jgi:hypothetical protein
MEQLCEDMLMTDPACESPIKDGVLGRDSKLKGSCPTTGSSDSSDSDGGDVDLLTVRGGERR